MNAITVLVCALAIAGCGNAKPALSPSEAMVVPVDARPAEASASEADRELTARIREALASDDSLSTTAKNIHVVTLRGNVTLRGPVMSTDERAKIETVARGAAGTGKVDSRLEVKVD